MSSGRLILGSYAQVVKNKGIYVSSLFKPLGGAARRVAGIRINANEHRTVVAGQRLECVRVFQGMPRDHAAVVIGRGRQRGQTLRRRAELLRWRRRRKWPA